jgi:multimeric flavodoxin WrbA
VKFLIVSGNPKKEGLCADITAIIENGARDGGAEVEVLTVGGLARCHVCGDGWGICRDENKCAFGGDGFDEAQKKMEEADAICLVTPVYWWEVEESLKGFIDRLRRCEFSFLSPDGALAGKQTLLVTSAGGSGNGLLTALEQLDRFCQHVGLTVFDRFGFNRWNHGYKKPAVYAAARAIAEGQVNGATVV